MFTIDIPIVLITITVSLILMKLQNLEDQYLLYPMLLLDGIYSKFELGNTHLHYASIWSIVPHQSCNSK